MFSIKNIVTLIIILSLSACSKFESGSDFTPGDPPPVPGGFINSSEIARDNLVTYISFDGSIDDSVGTVVGGQQNGTTSFVEGRKGLAYKGAPNAFITYEAGALADLKSFTVAYWINTSKHLGGAQSVFMLTREGPYTWGNLFSIIEGSDRSNNKMQMKLHFEKAGVPNVEHWIDPGDAFWPDDMYGAWRHVIYSYDETSSTAAWYISGNLISLPENVVKRTASGDLATGTPLGPLNFQDATKLVIGAFQSQLGPPYNTPDTWMLNYTGSLDEFRIYNKALTAQEASALYTLERQNR